MQEAEQALNAAKVLQGVLGLLYHSLDLGHGPCRKGFLCGQENRAILSSFPGHGVTGCDVPEMSGGKGGSKLELTMRGE